jgi:hypothetical protein
VLRGLFFAIVDEADSVLIDEARTPPHHFRVSRWGAGAGDVRGRTRGSGAAGGHGLSHR